MLLDLAFHYFYDWPTRHREKESRAERESRPERQDDCKLDEVYLLMRKAILNPDDGELFEKAMQAMKEFEKKLPPRPKVSRITYERLEDLVKAKEDLKALNFLYLLSKHSFSFETLASDSRIVYLLVYKEIDTDGLVEDFEDWMSAKRGFFLPEALTPSFKENLLPLLATPTDEESFKLTRYSLFPRSPVNFRPAFYRFQTFQTFSLWGEQSLVTGWIVEFVNSTPEALREWVRRVVLEFASEIVLKRVRELAKIRTELPEDNPIQGLVLSKDAFLDKLLIAPKKISPEDWRDLQANKFYRQVWDRLRQGLLIDRTGLPFDDPFVFYRKAQEIFKEGRVCPMCGQRIILRRSQFVCSNSCRQKLKRLKDKHFFPVLRDLGPLATPKEIEETIRERLQRIKHPWLKTPFDLKAIVERFLEDPSIHQQAA